MNLWGKAAGILILAVGAIAFAAPATSAADETLRLEIPELAGNGKVGTRSFELVDGSRAAGFDQTGKRRLMVQVTYPRRKKAGTCRNALYLPNGTRDRLLSFLALEGISVEIETRACTGGPVVKKELPLVVFSHAYTADRAVYTSLVNDLASRGYMVASIDHTSDAFAVQFPDGEVVDGIYGSPLSSKPIEETELVNLVNVRTRDVRFVTSWLLRQNRAKGSWLSGRIDRKRIGVFGHSLGGATATRVGLVDKRFLASADVDGSLFGEWPLVAKSNKPFLLFTATDGLASVLPEDKSCRYFTNATGPKLAWELSGAKHLSFSDFQVLAPQLAERKPDWAFSGLYPIIIGDLDPAASVLSQRTAIARFFNAYVKSGKRPKQVKAPAPPTGVGEVPADRLACAAPA